MNLKKLFTHILCIIKKIDECKDFKLLILRSLGKKKTQSQRELATGDLACALLL